MVVLTADVVHNRLQDIKNPTQEAIETMSLWIMHYKDKASIDLIVEGWLNCFKTAGTDGKRIALFYVMNDVVQKAKMKHTDMLIPAFQPAVLTAVGIGRKQEKVKTAMKRCIEIFKSRNVFSPASITAMENLLDADEAYDGEDQALEVDTDDLFKKITNFVSARNVISDMMKCVNEGDFDYKEKCRSGMRDRESGAHILQEVHDAIDTMVQVRHSMENQKKKMMALSETLELAKRVFLHQKREVLVVEEAYVNFRDGIKAVHTDLLEMEKKGVYPGIVSPAGDDDHFATSSAASGDDSYRVQNVTSWGDNRTQIDMEMDEEDRPTAPMMKPSLAALVGIASQPSLQSRIMQLGLKKIADGDEEMLQTTAPATTGNDFTRPPPLFANNSGELNTFGLNINQPPIAPTDPRKRSENEGISQYSQIVQQHGMSAPPAPPPAQINVAPTAPQSVYQGHFETRDPRLLTHQQHSTSVYRAQFETTRDPRLVHQQPPPPPVPLNAYQATFDVKPPLVSPQPQPPTGGYQARFEQKMMPPVAPPPQINQYHQQQGAGVYRPPQQNYNEYHGGDRKDVDHRYERTSGGYHQPQRGYQNDRTPYSNPRTPGGTDRWRNGGGYNDRNSRGGRDNWRGGRGGYNRY
ncbi:unnamed protein product [Caenorhabditis sp. 36 PRJEB53466]|nr:unnamed protein product [Caenorhabditis sp. 36 PRJEB53466]